MATVAERKAAAIIAAACADAAAQPLHWIYDQDKLNRLIEGKEEIEFRDPSENPFCRIQTGKNTCYGDQSYCLLKSLVDNKGFNSKDLAGRYYATFGPGTDYDDPNAAKNGLPISGPWRNGIVKDFLKNYEENKEEPGSIKENQVDGVTKLSPIVAFYAGKPECMDKVDKAVRVNQNEDDSVELTQVAGRILEKAILLGKSKSMMEILDEVIDELGDTRNSNRGELSAYHAKLLRQVKDARQVDHVKAVQDMFVKS